MPNCDGSSVRPRQGDLMLCDSCDETLENESSSVLDAASDGSVAPVLPRINVQNELLCFVQRKSTVMTFDNLVSVCELLPTERNREGKEPSF